MFTVLSQLLAGISLFKLVKLCTQFHSYSTSYFSLSFFIAFLQIYNLAYKCRTLLDLAKIVASDS